jgi:prepilin-type N-terminal cleavage/methylation domain-containing protein
MTNVKGFSLIEVLITLSIISALSALAVPQYMKYREKAKRAEAQSYINVVAKAQKIAYANRGVYVAMTPAGNNSVQKDIDGQVVFHNCPSQKCTNYTYRVDVGSTNVMWRGGFLVNNVGTKSGGCPGWGGLSADNDSFTVLAVADLNEDTSTFLDVFLYSGGNGKSNVPLHVCDDINLDNPKPNSMPSGGNCGCTS